jgi:hypothetical protein
MGPISGFLYSQIGYDLNWPMRALVRGPNDSFLSQSATFEVQNPGGKIVLANSMVYWGEKWNAHWWVADFSGLDTEGEFELMIRDHGDEKYRSERIETGERLLWQRTWKTVALTKRTTCPARLEPRGLAGLWRGMAGGQ